MKVSVKRTNPSALAVAIAALVTAAMIAIIARAAADAARRPRVTFAAPERVTRSLTLSEEAYFFVTLGEYRAANEARVEAARLVSRGAAGYLWADAGRVRVVGNVYGEEAEAEKAADRLRREGISAKVVSLRVPQREIGLTATEAQISAFLAARSAVDRAMSELSSLSRRLDAGEINAAAARTQALVAAYDLQTATEPFLSAARKSEDAFAARFSRLISDQLDALRALSAGEGSEMILSSRVKYALVGCALSRAGLTGA